MQAFLEKNYANTDQLRKFEDEIGCYKELCILIKVIIEKHFHLLEVRYTKEVETLVKKYSTDITLHTVRNTDSLIPCSAEHATMLERLCEYENYKADLCTPLIRYVIQNMVFRGSSRYEFLRGACYLNIARHRSAVVRIYKTIAKENLDSFTEPSFKRKCLLTEKSVTAIRYKENDGYLILFILANNGHTHHGSLCKIAQLCKRGYMLVYKAMEIRLNESGPFHPLFIKNWCHNPGLPDALIEQTRQLRGFTIDCRIIATKEPVTFFKNDWNAQMERGNCNPLLRRIQPEMTWANKVALWAFGLSRYYYDMIYAIQTRYQHLYIEFEGDGQEKASKLFTGWEKKTSKDCALVFKLDDDDTHCYLLSFIVVKKKEQ